MKISYNWLKWYIPDVPQEAEKLVDIFTFHLCEVEGVEKTIDGDTIFDIKILPDRAHDLLSHMGVARELSALLDIPFVDPTSKYKIPNSRPTALEIDVQTDKCRRYAGRIIKGIKVGPSPEWIVKHLESIGQRSINNMVDVANLVMYNCGQPTHVFDLDKVKEKLVIRQAKEGEHLTTLDNKECKLGSKDMVIADTEKALAVAGVKGGKLAEVDENTTNIILEVANFDPISVRKTAQAQNIFTDAKKRFENDLSPELVTYAMRELSALIFEVCPEAFFEDIVDVYINKAEQKKINVSADYINKRLGSSFSYLEIESVWKKLNFEYEKKDNDFDIQIPLLRLDLQGAHDLAEEVIRVLGYDRLEEKMPELRLESKTNETFKKIILSREKLLGEGYSEVMTYTFRDTGELSVLASASDKNYLRTNLSDGLKESIKLNQVNAPLMGMSFIKVFEIGTVFKITGEEIHVAWGDRKEVKEVTLDEFCKEMPVDFKLEPRACGSGLFKMWSLYPFIARDVAVWVPEGVESREVENLIRENMGDFVVRGPELFDEFKKEGRVSYAFRIVFQSYEKTLTDAEVNEVMNNITQKITEKEGWQAR